MQFNRTLIVVALRCLLVLVSSGLWMGCQSSNRIALKPATILYHDVFTCKGLSADNRWVGVTDVFLPEKDSQVVVVAQLTNEEVKEHIFFELINPADNVAVFEKLSSPNRNPIGIYFSIPRLLDLGGEGKWKATVYANEVAIGQTTFYIGEKPEEEEEDDSKKYFVVGTDSGAETDNQQNEFDALDQDQRYGSLIKEVSPEFTIPLDEAEQRLNGTLNQVQSP